MSNSNPKVSIGLPVFNGEKYIKQSIDSILNQSFADFELIISDNASTDQTEQICKEYAAKDPRIRFYRNNENIGGSKNYNRTFELSRGQYFHFAAHDDICSPELIAKCVEILDREPEVVLCYSTTVRIDENGKAGAIVQEDKGLSSSPYERFCDLIEPEHLCETLLGLIRSDVLRKTDLLANYPDSDRNLLCVIGLYGKFYRICEPLFYKRYHAERSMAANPDPLKMIENWFREADKRRIQSYCQLRQTQSKDYLKSIARAPISFSDRIGCYVHTIVWFTGRKFVIDFTRVRRKFITKNSFSFLNSFFDRFKNLLNNSSVS